MNEYASLSDLRTFMSLASAEVSDDEELRKILTRASRQIDRYCRRYFYPKRHTGTSTLKYDLPQGGILRFDEEDVLEIKGLSHINGASEIDSSVYWLKCGDNWNITPYDRLELDESSGSIFNFTGTPQRAVHVDAITGYRENYGDSWINSGGSLTDALGAAITTASVSASQSPNLEGIWPRFYENQVWKVDNEFMYVQDTINASSVRLIRGINGTTAAAHAASATIYTWQPEYDIEEATIELSAFAYQKAKSPFSNRISVLQLGVIEQPDAWPERTKDKLERYRKSINYAF